MVKKKSPIIPLTFIAIGVAVAFAVNTRLHPVDPKDAAAQAAAQDPPKEMKPLDKSQEIQAAMKNELQNKGAPGAAQMGKSPAPGMPPHGVMVGQKMPSYRPRPNSSGTDMEWYKAR